MTEQYEEQGERALQPDNVDKHPRNRISEDTKTHIINLRKSDAYCTTSILYFQKLLANHEGIQVSYTCLRKLLQAAELLPKKDAGKIKNWHLKHSFGGRLVAAVISCDWFNTKTPCALHLIFDEATKKITGLHFSQNACVNGHLETLYQTLTYYGIPRELYVEAYGGSNIFDCKPHSATQLDRIIEKHIGIEVVKEKASTHSSKCRIKEFVRILQKHLPRWLKKVGITNIEHGNRELYKFISFVNDSFTIEPRIPESSFVSLGCRNIPLLLSVRHKVMTDSEGCFFFDDYKFVTDSVRFVNKEIDFLYGSRTGFLVYYEFGYYPVSILHPEHEEDTVSALNLLNKLVHEAYFSSFI